MVVSNYEVMLIYAIRCGIVVNYRKEEIMKKRILMLSLALVLLIGLIAAPATAGANGAPDVLMCFLLDSSGSINSSEWGIMLDGLKAAVNDANIMPRDGSLQICIVQFGNDASEELGPTIVTAASVPTILAAIDNIDKDDGCTALGYGINQAVSTMSTGNSAIFDDPDVWKVINVATDGVPNTYPTGWPNPTGGTTTCGSETTGMAYAEACVTAAISAGIDELDVEGIGTTGSQNTWMADDIVVPDGPGGVSGWIVNDGDSYPPRPPVVGFVRVCSDFEDYQAAIAQKLTLILKGQLSLDPPTATNLVGEQHCVTATLLDGALQPLAGETVNFTVTGANSATGSGTTDSNGEATFCYTGTNLGLDTIVASWYDDVAMQTLESNTAEKTWNRKPPPTTEVGGTILPTNKLMLLTPLLALGILLAAWGTFILRRRKAQS
jgi:hypothetical protein